MADLRPELAEAVGLFFIVLAGGAAILVGAGGLAVALAFAFVVAVMIYAVGHVSGAHFNPAITLAFAVSGHFPWRRVGTYVLAQSLGAIAASLLLLALFPNGIAAVVTQPHGISLRAAFFAELFATALLAFVIIAVATDKRASPGIAGIAIGLSVGIGAIAIGPLTGDSVNPARSLGPALVSWQLANLWLYVVAPCIGACLAMLAYDWLRSGENPVAKEVGSPSPKRDEI